jgi:hypothetical protein
LQHLQFGSCSGEAENENVLPLEQSRFLITASLQALELLTRCSAAQVAASCEHCPGKRKSFDWSKAPPPPYSGADIAFALDKYSLNEFALGMNTKSAPRVASTPAPTTVGRYASGV